MDISLIKIGDVDLKQTIMRQPSFPATEQHMYF